MNYSVASDWAFNQNFKAINFMISVSECTEDSEISQRELQEHPEWTRHE